MLEKVERPSFNNQSAKIISENLLSIFRRRKTTRYFQPAEISEEIILNAIAIAGTAPSGANKQPWAFSLVADLETKTKIRERAEQEEQIFYHQTAPQKWLNDLKPLHTNANKAFITEASYLIPVFSKQFNIEDDKTKTNNYYVKESVGIATGLLISALHLCGLSVLTYTPSNRQFLVDLLGRPRNERTFMVLTVGLASDSAMAPTISKKALNEILSIFKNVPERKSYQESPSSQT